jgi:hypothetical protein
MPKPENEFDALLRQLTGNLVMTVNSMPQAPSVAGKVKLTKAEQVARYQANKDNPGFWNDIVAKHGKEGAYLMWKDMSEKEGTYAPTETTG